MNKAKRLTNSFSLLWKLLSIAVFKQTDKRLTATAKKMECEY